MRAGNSEALDAIFRSHYERITRVIGRVIHDQARAEELAVEVFLKWRDQPDGWLYRTAVRKALDELRSQIRRSRLERFLGANRKSPPTPEQLYAANAEQRRVRTVLGALPHRQAGILLLRSHDLSYRRSPPRLNCSRTMLGNLVSRAQEAFQKEYRKRYGNQS